MRIVPLAMLLVACGHEVGDKSSRLSALGSHDSVRAESLSSAGQAESLKPKAESGAPCPATGVWAPCNVFDRLDRAGLAPRHDTTTVALPPLSPRGSQLLVGNAKLQLYVYPDVRTREREQGLLDKTKYVSFDAPTMQSQPTLIHNANLIAILFSRNDHLRERVSDAITAGPPQPPSSPPTKP